MRAIHRPRFGLIQWREKKNDKHNAEKKWILMSPNFLCGLQQMTEEERCWTKEEGVLGEAW